jgi:hypothetical protein
MDCKAIIDVLLTVVIALFSGLTWRATSAYATIAGLSLFLETHKELVGIKQGVDRAASIGAMKVIREAYPQVYTKMSKHMNPQTKKEVEGS